MAPRHTLEKVRYAVETTNTAQRIVQECKLALYDKEESDNTKMIRHNDALTTCRMSKAVTDQAILWYKQTGGSDALPALNRLLQCRNTGPSGSKSRQLDHRPLHRLVHLSHVCESSSLRRKRMSSRC